MSRLDLDLISTNLRRAIGTDGRCTACKSIHQPGEFVSPGCPVNYGVALIEELRAARGVVDAAAAFTENCGVLASSRPSATRFNRLGEALDRLPGGDR